jgi:hypothetical protein
MEAWGTRFDRDSAARRAGVGRAPRGEWEGLLGGDLARREVLSRGGGLVMAAAGAQAAATWAAPSSPRCCWCRRWCGRGCRRREPAPCCGRRCSAVAPSPLAIATDPVPNARQSEVPCCTRTSLLVATQRLVVAFAGAAANSVPASTRLGVARVGGGRGSGRGQWPARYAVRGRRCSYRAPTCRRCTPSAPRLLIRRFSAP